MANLDTRLEFVGNAKPTTLTGAGLSLTGTSFSVSDATNYPTGAIGDFVIVINRAGSTAEKVLCSDQVSGVFTISQRGYDGTVPATHDPNETVEVCWPATEADASNSHRASTSGLHGVAGDVVGTSDTQTLTNKSLDGGSNTFTNIPESAVSGLVAALQTLTGSESTDAANIKANADAITTLQSQVSAGLGLLTSVDYTSTSGFLTTSLTAVDTTNLSPSFTVPASGKVLIRVSGSTNTGNSTGTLTLGWKNHSGGSQVGRSQTVYLDPSSSSVFSRFAVAQTLTGLTAGALRLDLAASYSSGSQYKLTDVTIEVWAA